MAIIDKIEVNSDLRDIQDSAILVMISTNVETSTTATAAHVVGSYFILNRVFYKTTVAIAVGDTIAVGTNCAVATLSEILQSIESAIVVDSAISATSVHPVQNKVIKAALDGKQATLTFDSAPTLNSSNPVTSNGIKAALNTMDGNVKAGSEDMKAYHMGFYIGEDGGLYQSDD